MLFDNGAPNPIARSLTGHEANYARQIGWHELKNGELIDGPRKPDMSCFSAPTKMFDISRTYRVEKSLWSFSAINNGRS